MAFTGLVTKFNRNKDTALIKVDVQGQPDVRTTTRALIAAGITGAGQRVEFETRRQGNSVPTEYINFRAII